MTSSFFARYESDFYEWSMQQAALVAEASVSVSLGPMAPYDGFKFRDSPTEMDSRFRGNDVISARHVTFRLAVIPAKAGIHHLIQGILNPET